MKSELRVRMKKERRALTKEQQALLSAKIQENAWPLLADAESVMLYADSFKEVGTGDLAQWLLSAGKKVYYPRVLGEGDMEAVRIHSLSDLAPGAMGIPEPVGKELVRDVDVIIMPGLAFSQTGARLGFGAGYYDRFLESTQGKRIALAYSFQVLEEIPSDPHDIPMHRIVTEKGIYDCIKEDEE